MPPPETGKRLNKKQKEILEEWIKQGANYEEHWSFLPIANPDIPTNSSKSKSDHPVDRFLAQRIENKPFQFSQQTDKITQLRRLFFDLLGMPPTPEEAKSFSGR